MMLPSYLEEQQSVPLPTNRGFLLSGSDRNIICSGLGNLVLAATSATLTIHKAPIRDGSPYNIRALNAPPDGVDAAPAFEIALCLSEGPLARQGRRRRRRAVDGATDDFQKVAPGLFE